ncbi:MAG: tetratricopeptide repeat protein, partial [Acidobacteriota bacterium]
MEEVRSSHQDTSEPVATPLEWSSPVERSRSRWLAPTLLGVVVVAALAWTVSRLIGTTEPPVELPLAGRLALLPFENRTADAAEAWVETGLMEMVAESVTRTAGSRMVSPARLRRVLAPRGFTWSDAEARERARSLALATGADQVLDARLGRQGDSTVIELELFDETGRVASSQLIDTDALAVADGLAFALARGLGGDREPRPMASLFARSAFLDRLYGTGLQALSEQGPAAARRYFEIALEHHPGFLQAKARLAECQRRMGEIESARQLTSELLLEAQSRGDRSL